MKQSKTIVVFGASGRTGKAVITEAIVQGFKVRTLNKRNPTITELSRTIRGSDAIVIVFGPRPPYTDFFCAATTKNIIKAMEAEKVSRLICQIGAMIGDYSQNRSYIFELMSGRFRKSNPQGYDDRIQQEKMVINSPLKWTIIKPPRLTETEDDKTVQVGEQIKIGILSSVSRRSLARFIIAELLTPHQLYKAVFVKN